MTNETNEDVKKGNYVYYARIIPQCGIYDVLDLKIQNVNDKYFTGTDKKDKKSYIFSYKNIDNCIFTHRGDALSKVLLAQNGNESVLSSETYYEEY